MAKGEPMKKGFIFSFSTIMIFSFLVLFSSFYLQKTQREETSITENFAVEKAGFVADNITNMTEKLLGTATEINRNQGNTIIFFYDRLPPYTAKSGINEFDSFIEQKYAQQQKAQINLNSQKLLDGKTELVFSNGLQYDYDYSGDQNSVMFYRPGLDTGTTEYDINVIVSGAEYSPSPIIICFGGSVTFRIHLEDSFGNTVDTICNQNPGNLRNYNFNFTGESGRITISIGNYSSNPNAVRIENTINNPSVSVETVIKAVLAPEANELTAYYDADLNYSQADTNINRKIEIKRV